MNDRLKELPESLWEKFLFFIILVIIAVSIIILLPFSPFLIAYDFYCKKLAKSKDALR